MWRQLTIAGLAIQALLLSSAAAAPQGSQRSDRLLHRLTGDNAFRIPVMSHRSGTSRASTMQARVRTLQKHMLQVPGKWLQEVQSLPMFKLDLDTGSGDIWLAGQECRVCSRHKKFDPDRSSTHRYEGRKWGISYGDGSFAAGTTIRDTVSIGKISVPNQVIGLATNESRAYQVDTVDGLLGLAHSGVAFIPGVTTFLDNMYENNILKDPIFSVYITEKDKDGFAGEYLFGSYDKSKFIGDLTWVPLYQPKFWQILVDGVSFNVQSLSSEKMDIKGPAILDTGTTLIVMNDEQATRVVPGNLTFTIAGADLIREPVKGLDGWCFSAVTSGASNFIILGDIFLRSNYVVFDRGQSRVGIAPSKHQ
ncbi:acid protease [Linderina pennispora]|uniref:Acid protease n=1 Tax=Linderina pennispora TaxID=61395 RepID=A0A1Y1W3V6_9FUNG|nr:acid protease [Linderina pennispora]ORX68201.1 acid protease [Linderina pennispora]